MMEILAGILAIATVAVVWRWCSKCWQRTDHYKFDSSDGETMYKCSGCGFSFREREE